ncbi:molybdopterin-guanine dinucleotide biosynthesis protein B [Slackia heliotrinireducens]|uniref:molybdopterin-guanine dinucleotide biosynthesis protein B n=1 Tax=Slackia heliotrinireducens TaxID=84110 RepID=UPI0033163808
MGKLFIPSPAISFVGRHNSGKTTLLEKVIAELANRGVNVGSLKHHGHSDFEIDYPGKDSYRHRAAGSRDVVVVSPKRMARITELDEEPDCLDILKTMPGHDIVIVEGFRQSGLDVIEVMRDGNERDHAAADEFCELATVRGGSPHAVVSDMPRVHAAAVKHGIPCFGLEEIKEIVDFLMVWYVRPKLTVVVQAGGESRRMGQSKACVPFLGEPLLKRIVQRVSPAADELIITTNEPERLAFLDEVDLPVRPRLVTDFYDTRGALRGVYTALQAAQTPLVALVACDMVFASAPLIVAESQVAHEERVEAVVPVTKFGYEPFHAVYRRDECLKAAAAALEKGSASATSMFEYVRLRGFTRDEVRSAVPAGGCFVNVNTPEELHRVEQGILDDGDK